MKKNTQPARLLRPLSPVPCPPVWRFKEHSRNVHELTWPIRGGFRDGLFIASDCHWDHPHCDRSALRAHLDEALRLRRPVIFPGDFFCAMQGKFDNRGSKGDIRPEHAAKNYFNLLVNSAAAWLQPYAGIIALISPGNHETAVLKQHEIDLCEMLVEALRVRCPASPVRLGGYTGWIRLSFRRCDRECQSLRLWYHHGYGGGGPVTRGVIQTNRQAVYVQADIIVNGHTHDAWVVPIQQIALSDANVPRHTQQLHIRTPGYKDEYAEGTGGWHIERGGPPKPIGGAWLEFVWQNKGHRIHPEARLALRHAA